MGVKAVKWLKEVLQPFTSQLSVNCALNKTVTNPKDTERLFRLGPRGQCRGQEAPSNKDALYWIFPTCGQQVSRESSWFLPQIAVPNKQGGCNKEASNGVVRGLACVQRLSIPTSGPCPQSAKSNLLLGAAF